MTKFAKSRHTLSSRQFRSTPYSPSHPRSPSAPVRRPLVLERSDYAGATCSVCMEFPHNAVLLLCSSHDTGCHPFMCGTSDLHSNCLDQFYEACSKVRYTVDLTALQGTSWASSDLPQILELACPLCRGQVKGWTVVEPARKYLNDKKRYCTQDGCSFVGTYEELENHAKSKHPLAKPREVDPEETEKWSRLEFESEQEDEISSITFSIDGSTDFGKHVIDIRLTGEGEEDDDFEEMINSDIMCIWRDRVST